MRSLVIIALLLSMGLPAVAAPLPDVGDLFAGAPNHAIPIVSTKTGKPLSKDERAKLITLEDAKNAYLEVRGTDDTDIFGGGEMTLFKTKAGSFLIGWHLDSNGDGTEAIAMFQLKETDWIDVTKDVLPKITPAMADKRAQAKIPAFKKEGKKLSDCASGTYAYKLPRKGTAIDIVVSSDCYTGPKVVLWTLRFDGERFMLGK